MTSPPSAPDPAPGCNSGFPSLATLFTSAPPATRSGALALYEWNAQLSPAVHRDLAHLEVGLRNAYDQVLARHWPGPPHWTQHADTIFVPLYRRRGQHRVDVNRQPRTLIQQALRAAGGTAAPAGKVIAELPFGCWRYLSSAAHEKTLWVSCLHRAFPAGTDRRDVEHPVGRLHQLRSRVAHQESLRRADVSGEVPHRKVSANYGWCLTRSERVRTCATLPWPIG